MGRSLAWRVVDSTVVLVHADAPVDNGEWAEYVKPASLASRVLVIVGNSPGPSAKQRKLLKEASEIREGMVRIAVISDNPFARGAISLFGLFTRNLSSFRTSQFDDALLYLGEQRRALMRKTVEELQAELGASRLR